MTKFHSFIPIFFTLMSIQIGFVPNEMNEPVNLEEKDLKCNNSTVRTYVFHMLGSYVYFILLANSLTKRTLLVIG